jgi:hypothetical protein
MTTPEQLLDEAAKLIDSPAGGTAGAWPKAAAVLARQALELSVRERLVRVDPTLERASMRSQLTCLRAIAKDTDAAASASLAWSRLSTACHYHPYELTPSASELRALLATVGDVAERLR